MPSRKFKDGQTVTVIRNKRSAKARGSYEVGRLLPEVDGVNQYLILSTTDGQLRVVSEHEIV